MKLRQGEMKKTMKGILAGAFLLAAGSAAVFAVGTETELKAYAAEWQQAENGDWTYKEDDGSLASGWQKIDGVWYDRKMGRGTAIRPWMRLPSAIWWRMR